MPHRLDDPLSQEGFEKTREKLGGDVASLWALLSVETRGFGFLADRRPKILFERHVFHGRTGGRFGRSHPDLSSSRPGGYLGGPAEYQRLKRAMLLDRRVALESASWGLGQVMGFNATKIGYPNVDVMVDAFTESEDAQLEGCARFIDATKALKDAFQSRDWARVAFFYNGPQYAVKGYHIKLLAAHTDYTKSGAPAVAVRRLQAYLTYLGFAPKGVDGEIGRGTTLAVEAFRKTYKKELNGTALPTEFDLEDAANRESHLRCLEAAFRSKFAA